MNPFKKILVPIDFAPHSAAAVSRALEIADAAEAQIVLVHVYEPGDYAAATGYINYTPEQLERQANQELRRLDATRADAEAAGRRSVTTRLLYGTAAATIVELAAQERFDLIVMGTHGRKGFARWMMGSVAEEVARAAPCSVLTVKLPIDAAA